MQFTPLKDFFSPELKSEYCVGLSYTLRAIPPDPNANGEDEESVKRRKGIPAADTLLAKLLPQWIKDGKVRLGSPIEADALKHLGQSGDKQEVLSHDAQVTGIGEVK